MIDPLIHINISFLNLLYTDFQGTGLARTQCPGRLAVARYADLDLGARPPFGLALVEFLPRNARGVDGSFEWWAGRVVFGFEIP